MLLTRIIIKVKALKEFEGCEKRSKDQLNMIPKIKNEHTH